MRVDEYAERDGIELASLVATGEVTPEELLDAALRAAETVNPAINAIVATFPELARDEAARVSGESALAGVPFLVKDLRVRLRGTRTSNGSRLWRDAGPAGEDDEIARRFRSAGLVAFGKTNTPELGFNITTEPVLFGPTRNPWNLGRSAGGSSGGAAAAVSAGLVPIAHASDGGGSIRIPASCCGVFGLKPSRGRTPCGPGAGDVWNGLSLENVISRTVRDSARAFDAIQGPAAGDPYAAAPLTGSMESLVARPEGGPLRIAFSTTAASGVPVEDDCRAAVHKVARAYESLGHHVVERDLRFPAEEMAWAFRVISGSHALADAVDRASELGLSSPYDALEPGVAVRVRHGSDFTAADYARALHLVQGVGRSVGRAFEDFDVHITPTVAQIPQPLGHFDAGSEDTTTFQERVWRYIPFTAVFNVTGQPAMSVPAHLTADGLPVGVQVAARLGREDQLFLLAAQLEATEVWVRERPRHSVR